MHRLRRLWARLFAVALLVAVALTLVVVVPLYWPPGGIDLAALGVSSPRNLSVIVSPHTPTAPQPALVLESGDLLALRQTSRAADAPFEVVRVSLSPPGAVWAAHLGRGEVRSVVQLPGVLVVATRFQVVGLDAASGRALWRRGED